MDKELDLAVTCYGKVKPLKYDLVLLPWGATEPHNLHLPYLTDCILSHDIALDAAKLAKTHYGIRCMVLPHVTAGSQNPGQRELDFCIHYRYETQKAILSDLVASLYAQGYRKMVIINGHGGNTFKSMIRDLSLDYPDFLIASSEWFAFVPAKEYFDEPGDHADELETSVMMHYHPELVNLDEAGNGDYKKFTSQMLNEKVAWIPCFVNNIVYAGVGLVGAVYAVAGGITIGQLSIFLNYANQYTKPFNEISGVVTELQNALACAARVFELLDAEDQVPEAENAKVLETDGHVELKDVFFRYLPDRPLIEGLDLDVKPGQRIAIVGPTGCGKTTLINLLMRFYDVNGGSIEVAGNDIRSLTRASLRGSYGMVLQETWLRAGTVRENIAYGKPDATEEEIVAAAKAAHADSFIRRLPKGYDTVIAEDGGNISQGQKQLLCIARVMLCLPPMLILDEATSSIDTRTEVRIQAAFARMMQGRTSFIVAHRLSTIREADVILVMKDGHIVEQGDHDTLLAQGGFYAKLYNSQFEGVET